MGKRTWSGGWRVGWLSGYPVGDCFVELERMGVEGEDAGHAIRWISMSEAVDEGGGIFSWRS